jgi:prepilin-type N-terminal cleavage/methylation domain-containing protein
VLTPAKQSKSAGFTIIELLIATAIFSVLLVVITAGIISFSRQYYKGVVSSNTQTTARNIMSEIVQGIQFGSTIQANLTDGSNTQGFCIDDKLYSYVIGQQVSDRGANAALHQQYHGFVVDNTNSGCSLSPVPVAVPTSAALSAGQRELLGDRMRLTALDIETEDSVTYKVHIRIVYGEDDLLAPDLSVTPIDWPKETCVGDVGSQYCAVTDLTTTIQKRI